ncbi:MAG: DUF4199 domain-containing protein [Bacteroidota bacterium]
MTEKAKAPFLKPALIYGAIVGFVSILFGVIFYIMDLSLKGWSNWVTILLTWIVLIYCLLAYRKEYLGGFASYGQILFMAVMISVVAVLLNTVYTYVLHGMIDNELLDKMRLVQEEKLLSNPRVPENMHDTLIARLEKSFTLKKILINGAIGGLVLNTIVGLIAAAFIKKDEAPANSAV